MECVKKNTFATQVNHFLPLEEMDLYVHPGRNELAPLHPEGPVMTLK
jgi:hypothetical protein